MMETTVEQLYNDINQIVDDQKKKLQNLFKPKFGKQKKTAGNIFMQWAIDFTLRLSPFTLELMNTEFLFSLN